MQGPIEQALMLVAAGNAFLGGRDIGAFWPDSPTFRFTRSCEFRTPPVGDSETFPLAASDPMQWLASLKPWCRGLRLHFNARELLPGQTPGVKPHMLVGFVGGGPRWLIEAVAKDKSEIWEGFDKLGDRNDPERKIWLTTYIRQGEAKPEEIHPNLLITALPELKRILPEIEAYARSEQQDNFAACFASALAALDGPQPPGNPYLDAVVRYSGLDDAQVRVLVAVHDAWVFGGMGSWNDIGGGERYDALTEQLFDALCGAVCALANSTFRA